MNEPVVSGETNGIEFYASPLIPCPEIPEPIKCAESQPFQNGVEGLKETVKMKLIYKEKALLSHLLQIIIFQENTMHFVNPTVSGFYQANVLEQLKKHQLVCQCILPKLKNVLTLSFLNLQISQYNR